MKTLFNVTMKMTEQKLLCLILMEDTFHSTKYNKAALSFIQMYM